MPGWQKSLPTQTEAERDVSTGYATCFSAARFQALCRRLMRADFRTVVRTTDRSRSERSHS